MHQRRSAKLRSLARAALFLLTSGCASAWADDIVNVASFSFNGPNGPNGTITLPSNLVRTTLTVPSHHSLFVQKTASRDVAEIGDFVDFTVQVRNVSAGAFAGVIIDDRLPFGFVLERGSTRRSGPSARAGAYQWSGAHRGDQPANVNSR